MSHPFFLGVIGNEKLGSSRNCVSRGGHLAASHECSRDLGSAAVIVEGLIIFNLAT